jgi:HK97 family phage portal protein
MSILGLVTTRELTRRIDEAVKAVAGKYPDWLLQTAGNEKYNLPDPSIYGNQADLYRRLSWVLAAVTHVASEAALDPLSVREAKGEEMEDVKNHPFEMLLRRPNPLDSRYEFVYGTVAMKKLTGNAYWWMNRPNESAEPDELWLIPSHMIQPVPDNQMYIKGYLYSPGNGASILLEPWTITHFRSFNPFSRFTGLSAIEALATIAQGDLGMQDWNTKLFKENNARLPGILTFAEMVNDPEWDKIKEATREAAKNRQLMMLRGVGQGNVSWLQNAVSQKDMEFLSGRQANKEEIFTVLAPGLASMLDPSATEANALAGRATFRERAVYPELVSIQEKITTSILPAYGENLYAEFEDIRYIDRQLELSEQAEYSKSHTVEEIRQKYSNDKPLGDERDKLFPVQITADTGKPEPPPQPIPPQLVAGQQTTTPPAPEITPQQVKAIVELDRWEEKSNKAGKLVTFHPVDMPTDIHAAIKAERMTFAQARERVKGTHTTPAPEHKTDAAIILEAIRLEVEGIKKNAVSAE